MKDICSCFDYSKQAYYQHKKYLQKLGLENEMVLEKVRIIRGIHPRIGTKKLYFLLNNKEKYKLSFHVGRDRLFNLLKSNCMLIEPRKRSSRTTNSNHHFRCYKNLIKDNNYNKSHTVLVSDITYIRHNDDFYYLSLITDYVSRKIVGYYLSKDLKATGAIKALKRAISKLEVTENVIHHSGRGIQYCCYAYTNLLKENNMKISMTEEDHVYENALAERVNGILKDEYFIDVINETYEEAKKVIKNVIEVYNNERIHESLNYLTPKEYLLREKLAA